jgi:hypothetical protein
MPFLDELPEFSQRVLEALRQPLEDARVVVSRSAGTASFPARFQLVAAANPCRRGCASIPTCACSPGAGSAAQTLSVWPVREDHGHRDREGRPSAALDRTPGLSWLPTQHARPQCPVPGRRAAWRVQGLTMTDRQLYQLLERAVLAMERIAGIDPPAAKTPKPPLSEVERKALVSVVHRGEAAPEWTGRLPPGGGHVHPDDFLAR